MQANIYTDLGIECDPEFIMNNPADFDKLVKEKADELLSVMASSSRFSTAVEAAQKSAKTNKEANNYACHLTNPFDSDFYLKMEEMDDPDVTFHVAEKVATLAKDLQTLFESQIRDQQLREASTVEDKKLAHWQYSQLRDAFDSFRKFSEMMGLGKFVPLSPKSGNFGASSSLLYIFGEDRVSNPVVAAKRLGIKFESTASLREHIENLDDDEIRVESL